MANGRVPVDSAKMIKMLSMFLGMPVEEVWKTNVDEGFKEGHTWEEFKEVIDTFKNPEDWELK